MTSPQTKPAARLAFVTPWYGPDIPGGMEAETRRTAHKLAQAGWEVEVLTTCIRDFYADWGRNAHRPGAQREDGVLVRRFPVGRRDKAAFDRVNWQLMQGVRVGPEAERIYIEQMFTCPELYAYIRAHHRDTLFIFIPYMFATTHFGVQIAPARSLVIPCLHDESYAYMDIYRHSLPQAHGLICHTQAEKELADRLWGASTTQVRAVMGEGVDTGVQGDGARFRAAHNVTGPLALYAGRKEPGKNTPLLLACWQEYVAHGSAPAELILVGPGEAGPLPPRVRDLGFVPRQTMLDAMAAADVLIVPSVNESFSLVLMEGWLMETPALVHGACAPTREHCQRSQGGLYFTHPAEFVATLDYLFQHPTTAARMGQLGRAYVLNHFHWDVIVTRYHQLLTPLLHHEARPA